MSWLTRLLDRFEPPLPELEHEYCLYYLPDDIAQTRVVASVVFVSGFVFISSDYLLFQTSAMFYVLLGVRIIFGLFNLFFIEFLGHVRQPRQYENLAFAWMLITLAFTVGVDATRPPTYLGLSLLHVTYIFVVYLALPAASMIDRYKHQQDPTLPPPVPCQICGRTGHREQYCPNAWMLGF